MEVTSNTKDTPPSVAREMEEKSGDAAPIVLQAAPDGSRCQTPTNSHQVDSPSSPRAS